jgi:predicted SAM-dependent methyltransferase
MDLQLCVDYPLENQRFSGDIYLAGWVISADGSAYISVDIDNVIINTRINRIERAEVFSVYPDYKSTNPLPGFTAAISETQIPSGVQHILRVTANENDNHINKSIKIHAENIKSRQKLKTYFKWKHLLLKILSKGKFFLNKPVGSDIHSNIGFNRKQLIISKIKPDLQEGLEIGPLCSPIVTKKESNGHVWYVDHVSTEELKVKYQNEPSVSLEKIVDVDFVWGKNSLSELTNGNLYDYVIASHVIEHVPDMLGWLIEISEVLKDNGILSLVIPDKRYSFDYIRELSTPGMLLEAYLRHQRQPGPREIFDFLSSASTVDVASSWNETIDKSSLVHYYDLQYAFDIAKDSFNNGHYQDVHVNTFTPESFLNLLETFVKLNLFDFKVIDFYETLPYTLEFFISLERMPRNSNRKEFMLEQLESITESRKRFL